MNRTEQQFFALLQSGLWEKPVDQSLFSGDPDWSTILKMAHMQTVSGIIFDGISYLQADLQPPAAIMRQLYQTVIRIEKSHALFNERLTRLIPLLQSENIHPILLKGQGVAQNYPNPMHRQCGDIDLYIGKKDYRRACELAVEKGIVSNDTLESHKHFYFEWDGVAIEFHRIVEKFPDPFKNKIFQQWTQYHLQREKLQVWNLNDIDVLLPPPNFNALYIFNHAFLHFIADGIGCRQLNDWVMYLYRFHDQIDRQELMKDLKAFGLLRTWQIFGCIAVHQLGLSEEKFPFYTDKFRDISQTVILKDILLSGNFGRYDQKWATRPAGYLSGKFHNFRMKNRRVIQLSSTIGSNVGFYYLYYLVIGIQQIVNDKLK
ncbi:MAG: nucleotidyltransferase family protein [Proteiniphilum sp.]|uniref:nucleotidyltransferase domain-containing protein n=1 Tax=Proteiniphilum sp. TaxID=1926877 RepID=UPI002B21570E|nr:nucleotidyltransferase family protein [Proteiniphilum sp.]MEA5127405.1 nucleotidyltransferase family protein [Proteiniphilum sp.]